MNTQDLQEKADKLGVSVDVYLFLRQSNRKIRYFTYDLKRERIIIDGERVTFIPSQEDSYDRLLEEGAAFASEEKSVEDIAVESILCQQLRIALGQLNEGERRLIEEVFFSQDGEGKSEREAAESLGIPQKTLNERKLRILSKLKNFMEKKK